MELIFLYINQTENGFIEKQGFNFSPNHKFEVIVKDNIYIIKQEKCRKSLPDHFFDDSGCISNVTAIVGENGSGKSTLLNELSSLYFSVKDQDHGLAYNDYFAEKYEKEKRIAVFKDEDGLVCYHNIERYQFKNETDIRSIYLYQGSPVLQKMIQNNTGCENISKIYVSNSMYSIRNSVSTHKSINEIFLNVDTLETLKNMFYKKKIKNSERVTGGYFSYLDLFRNKKKANDFQQILDVLYIKDIYDKEEKGILSDNIKPNLYVSFKSYSHFIQDIMIRDERRKQNRRGEDRDDLMVAHEMLRSHMDNSAVVALKTDSICMAYLNLLYEIITYNKDVFIDIDLIRSKDDLIDCIDFIIQNNSKIQSLFANAYYEIKEFEECLCECSQTECLLPINDLAFDSKIEIRYGSTAYRKFFDLIEKYVKQEEHSFILKYIQIGGLQFSSGERALMNFFSWIHLLPFFHDISDDVQESLSDNVLLLIDEIDLYCHPAWQQKMLYYLIDEARALFHDKKVQIIFTTHSPIILSDMPKSNVIYLTRDEENSKCRIDEPEKHGETFGANIYKLFDDAFFLEEQGQVGEFAKNKIRRILDELKPEQDNNGKFLYQRLDGSSINRLEKEISLIGEPIIKDRLSDMLYKHKMEVGYGEEDIGQKMIRVYEEKIKHLRSGENK